MKASDFYRILSRVRNMAWRLESNPKQRFGVPSRTTFIKGVRSSFWYDPLSAVATTVRRDFVDRSNGGMNDILRLDPRTFRRIRAAMNERPGHSPYVRRKLLRACRLLR